MGLNAEVELKAAREQLEKVEFEKRKLEQALEEATRELKRLRGENKSLVALAAAKDTFVSTKAFSIPPKAPPLPSVDQLRLRDPLADLKRAKVEGRKHKVAVHPKNIASNIDFENELKKRVSSPELKGNSGTPLLYRREQEAQQQKERELQDQKARSKALLEVNARAPSSTDVTPIKKNF